MYSSEELADIHFMYGFANGNAEAARVEYSRRFPNRRCPDASKCKGGTELERNKIKLF